ncbi:MAG TPA: hypothetical protein VFG62_25430 [Rhodopila sp.]|jgi:hypothetical protein|nr:hypothetical protein [Rhodopila sp.]
MTAPSASFDRFQIAAAVDRLIYGDDDTFDPQDARLVLAQLPRRASPWIQFGIAGKMSGGSRRGFAAGVGDVKIKDERERQFEYHSANDAYSRAGQWKLMWIGKRGGQYVEIEQVMADVTDEGRGAMLCFTPDGEPLRMEIRINRSFRLFWSPIVVVVPGWKPWKTPAPPLPSAQANPFA